MSERIGRREPDHATRSPAQTATRSPAQTAATRSQVLAAVSEVLYIDDSDLFDGDDTDLRELGLDSVRFVLLMKQLGVDRESDVPSRLAEDLTIAGWVRELEKINGDG